MAREMQVPFQKIQDACKTTGFSMYYLRRGCLAGTVPHVKSGSTYYINVPALLRSLGATTEEPMEGGAVERTARVTDIRAVGRKRAGV